MRNIRNMYAIIFKSLLQSTIHRYYTVGTGFNPKTAKKFGIEAIEHCVDIHNLDNLISQYPVDMVVSVLLEAIIQAVTRGFEPQDRVALTLTSPGLYRDIGIPLTRYDQIHIEMVMDIISNALQSDDIFLLDDGLNIQVRRVKRPK